MFRGTDTGKTFQKGKHAFGSWHNTWAAIWPIYSINIECTCMQNKCKSSNNYKQIPKQKQNSMVLWHLDDISLKAHDRRGLQYRPDPTWQKAYPNRTPGSLSGSVRGPLKRTHTRPRPDPEQKQSKPRADTKRTSKANPNFRSKPVKRTPGSALRNRAVNKDYW